MSDVQRSVPEDDPLMVAWREYQGTAEYRNTLSHLRPTPSVTGGVGELWAAFSTGWLMAHEEDPTHD